MPNTSVRWSQLNQRRVSGFTRQCSSQYAHQFAESSTWLSLSAHTLTNWSTLFSSLYHHFIIRSRNWEPVGEMLLAMKIVNCSMSSAYGGEFKAWTSNNESMKGAKTVSTNVPKDSFYFQAQSSEFSFLFAIFITSNICLQKLHPLCVSHNKLAFHFLF